MTPFAKEKFARIFWSSKCSQKVIRALAYRPEKITVLNRMDHGYLVKADGVLVGYQSNEELLNIALQLDVQNTATGPVITDFSLDPRLKESDIKSFVDQACRGLNVSISKDAILNFEEGSKQAKSENYAGAIAAYRLAIKRSPSFALAHYQLGMVLEEIVLRSSDHTHDRYLESVHEYTTALSINQMLAPARLGRANAYGSMGQHAKAKLDRDFLVRHFPNNAEYLATKAYCDRLDDSKNSEQLLYKALQLDPNCARAYAFLGWIQYERGNESRAIAHCKSALKRDQNCAMASFCLGKIHLNRRNYHAAVSDFSNALKQGASGAYRDRAWCYDRLGVSCHAIGQRARADYYCRLACADYLKALEWEPTDAALYEDLGWNRYKIGDKVEALEALNHALRIDPIRIFSLGVRAELEESLGLYESANADRLVIMSLEPTSATDIALRAGIQKDFGDKVGAIKSYSCVLAMKPNWDNEGYWRLHDRRGMLFFETGDFAKFTEDMILALSYQVRLPVSH